VRCPECGKELESKAKLCPNCNRLIIESARHTSGDSLYSDVLKPHSRIDVKGLGSKMTGQPYVTAVRHKIAASDESESSQRFRCTNCGTVNEKNDKFCRTCGTRIASS